MFSLTQLSSLRWIPEALTAPSSPDRCARYEIQDKEKLPSPKNIRAVITDLLSQSHVPLYLTPYDRNLHHVCIQECRLKGYPVDKRHGKSSILTYLPFGVILASAAYAHLRSRSAQVFIAIYTAFMMWVDDMYAGDIRGVDTFNERFVSGQKQEKEGLDGLDTLLREIDLHWHGLQADIILIASLNFMTSTILELETQGMMWSPHAKPYATFLHVMSGISEAYAIFTFPPEASLSTYIQALPEFCLYICYMSDVLSFYKEECIGENGIYISNQANLRGEGRLKALRGLANDVSPCVSRVANILEGQQPARDAFQGFMRGYASFHTSFYSRCHANNVFPLP